MRGVYVLLLISLLGYTGRVSGQESVTITQCYEWARANYPQIHQMGLIDQTERYSLSNVGKAWLPQLSVSGKASYQSDVTKLPLDGDKISSLLPGFEIPSLSKDQYQVVAQVDQTIWDGGSTRSARALTRAEAIANREQLESELYALNDRVNQIYFGCLLQDELIRQNALLQKELQVNIERIKAMMDNGVVMQDKYMSQSVHLASLVQKHFRNTCRRVDRGVHQAGFLVLKASAMPSILVELGFISTPEEERYLNTDAGTTTLANGIFRAFLTYKREQEIRLNGSSQTILPEDLPEEKDTTPAGTTPNATEKTVRQDSNSTPRRTEKNAVAQTEDNAPVFKIQILTSSRPLAKNDKRLKGLKNVDYYKEGGLYKYTYGASSDYNKVLRTKRSITAQFKDAFIIAFKNGKKVNVNAAINEFKNKKK